MQKLMQKMQIFTQMNLRTEAECQRRQLLFARKATISFCHSRANGNPEAFFSWIPAFAGMTNHSEHAINNTILKFLYIKLKAKFYDFWF